MIQPSYYNMNDPEMFGRALEKLIIEVRARIMTEMKFLSNRGLMIFLEEVLDRYLDLKKLVIEPGRTPVHTIKSWGIDGDMYLFHPLQVKRGDSPENLRNIPGSVLAQAAEFCEYTLSEHQPSLNLTSDLLFNPVVVSS